MAAVNCYLLLGNVSSDNSLKKSCSKITLILISRRASKLLRLKMLYTFVRSQGICVANHAADFPCFLRISSTCLPIFIFSALVLFPYYLFLSGAKIGNKSQYNCILLWNLFRYFQSKRKEPPIQAFGCWIRSNEQTVGAMSVMCTSWEAEPCGTFHP